MSDEVTCCGNCRFHVGEQCHRMPPQVVGDTYSNTEGENAHYREVVYTSIAALWPTTKDSDWCGEHEPEAD
jgi:hypothetical protein